MEGTLTRSEENVIAIILDPRSNDDMLTDGFRNDTPEDGRTSALHFGTIHRRFERR